MQAIFKKLNAEKREFWATVYAANAGDDQHGDSMTPDELHKAVLRFGASPTLRVEHGGEQDLPVGTLICLSSFMTGDKPSPPFKRHSWIIHGKVAKTKIGDALWARIRGGAEGKKFVQVGNESFPVLTGFSMRGVGSREVA